MIRSAFALIPIALMLAGCSYSVANPLSEPDGPQTSAEVAAAKVRLATVDTLDVGRGFRGVLVQVTATAPLQGFYAPELRLLDGGRPTADGAVVLEAVALPPDASPVGAGPASARSMIAAQFVGDDILAGARKIRVVGTDSGLERPIPPVAPAPAPAGSS
ncbi:hypothetical protein FDP22_12910 [Paroceanicella profunda]|uniref:Copper chaperone PCu(A)C n=1 Tax=Paroceanicella profunda TaxID=2579971 RepID=A0A5B8FHU5_9RHOB|nr:hypothetical protein [Paroceanicella profunda]QDL92607.1 hypothetical protein FDP22_12910 [Paroceanicella profunda]